MRILIHPKHFTKSRFASLIEHFPHIVFTDDINDFSIEGMISWSGSVKKEVLDQYPYLKIVLLPSAGYDKADLDYLKQRHMILTNARGVYDIQIAEDVVSKILYFNRHMNDFQLQKEKHIWASNHTFFEIYGKTVGIIGAGSIGQRIAAVLKGFNAHVIGYRRQQDARPPFDQIMTGKQGLYDVLRQSDYVILAVPLNDQTMKLIDEKALKMMKKDALLVNIARSKVIDEKALIKALKEHWIRGAALDVTMIEPLPENHPLWDLPNVYISPHIAGQSIQANERVNEMLKTIIEQYINHEAIDNRIC